MGQVHSLRQGEDDTKTLRAIKFQARAPPPPPPPTTHIDTHIWLSEVFANLEKLS